jgi:hypothetical protein
MDGFAWAMDNPGQLADPLKPLIDREFQIAGRLGRLFGPLFYAWAGLCVVTSSVVAETFRQLCTQLLTPPFL